jgi:hypothetical protein
MTVMTTVKLCALILEESGHWLFQIFIPEFACTNGDVAHIRAQYRTSGFGVYCPASYLGPVTGYPD